MILCVAIFSYIFGFIWGWRVKTLMIEKKKIDQGVKEILKRPKKSRDIYVPKDFTL